MTLKGKRLTGSFGSMYGVKIPEKLDDMPLEELPYIEMFYRFVFGEKHSYYDLEITKDVKPQTNSRQSEEAAPTTDTTGENELKAQDEARTLPVRGHAVTERPQQVHEYFDPFDIEIQEHDFPLRGSTLRLQRAHFTIGFHPTAVLLKITTGEHSLQ